MLGIDAEVDDAPDFSHFQYWLRGILAGDRELAHDWLGILDEGPAELLEVARQGLRFAAEWRELANKHKRALELHGYR